MAVIIEEDWEWSWIGEGRPDSRPNRGRLYFDKIRGVHSGEELDRVYKIGDVVVMNGEQNDRWFAQIIELFQVLENDNELREILHMDSRRNAGSAHYELMRCTLRWFYNVGDVTKDALRRSRIPKPIENEVYFSDHVEKDGYNDVTVIEGLAFAVGSTAALEQFLREPPSRFVDSFDHVCIVRCFINSSIEEPVLRNLDKGELNFLLQNPLPDKDLYSKARQRMMGKGRKAPVMKSLSKKRKRHTRPVINFDNGDDFDPEDFRPNRGKSEQRLPKGGSSRDSKGGSRDRRRKHVVSDEDEDAITPAHDPSDKDDDAGPKDLSKRQAENLNAANDEVMDLVSELNASASVDKGAEKRAASFVKEDQATAVDVDHLGSKASLPFSNKRKKVQSKRRAHPTETIVIDGGSSDEEEARRHWMAKRAKVDRSEKGRSPFMPTPRSKSDAKHRSKRETSGRDTEPDAIRNADRDRSRREDTAGLRKEKHRVSSKERPPGKSSSELDVSPPRRGVIADPRQAVRPGKQKSSKDAVAMGASSRAVSRDPTRNLADGHGSSSKGKHRDSRRTKSPGSPPISLAKEANAGKSMERLPTEASGHGSKKQKSSSDREKRHGDLASMPESDDDDEEFAQWGELSSFLEKLKTEFDKMPEGCQEVLSCHVDYVFDLAIKKVSEQGLTGRKDANDEGTHLVVRDLLDELAKKLVAESGNSSAVRETDGIRV